MGVLLDGLNRALRRTTGFELVPASRAARDRMLLDHHVAAAAAARSPLSPDLQARIVMLGRLLRPRRAGGASKIRVGGAHDGGYVMLDDFDGVRTAFSLGVGPNVDWDFAVAERGLEVHQFDHTVAAAPRRHDRFRFHPRRIDATASAGTENLASLLASYGAPGDANLLKLDIEGAEWRLFAEAEPGDLVRFRQILCEFHALGEVQDDAHFGLMLRALRRLRERFDVVHLHANNFGGRMFAGDQAFPQFLEVTLVDRERYATVEDAGEFPTALDLPNDPGRPDHYLGRFAFADGASAEVLEARSAVDRIAAGFDPAAYLLANPDVARAGQDPWDHWRRSGWGEGRPLSLDERDFDRDAYLLANPDVLAAGFDALAHWRHVGRAQGRPATLRMAPVTPARSSTPRR